MGTGCLKAVMYLYSSHERHDSKPSLSIKDIAENYYGNRSGMRMEAAIRGSMAGQLVQGVKSGTSEKECNARIRPILEKTCLQCHGPTSELKVVDLSSYKGIKVVADVNTGESLHTLMKLSHVRLHGSNSRHTARSDMGRKE